QARYTLIKRVRYAKSGVERRGRRLSPDEVVELFHAADGDDTLAGARDSAVIAVLLGCGLRRAEISSLMVKSYDPRTSTLTVIGKGDKKRQVFVVGECEAAVKRWLDRYRPLVM